jgi:hypothetical protein
MSQDLQESLFVCVGVTLAILFWVWFFRFLYLKGWRTLIFLLVAIGWERLKFYIAWLRFSRRRDKLDTFLADADRTKRRPISGLIDGPTEKP